MRAKSSVCVGFTLVEVMVALAVVAIALPALMVALYQQVDGTAYLRDKSFAQMVADNKLTEIRLVAMASNQLPEGRAAGVTELADREWYWWRESTRTELDNFFRIEIRVALDEDREGEPLALLAAFMSGDFEQGEPRSTAPDDENPNDDETPGEGDAPAGDDDEDDEESDDQGASL